VRAELDELHKHTPALLHSLQSGGDIPVHGYVQLLRQRRQHKILEVVQENVMSLVESEPNPTNSDPKVFMKERLGDPPQPPVASLDQNDVASKVKELSFRLKRELLVASSRLGDTKTFQSEMRSKPLPSKLGKEKTELLRRARDDLIAWVEGELTKIPENDVDSSQIDVSLLGDDDVVDGDELNGDAITKNVQELYDCYIATREQLVTDTQGALSTSVQSAENIPKNESALATTPGSKLESSEKQQLRASQILPYLPVMLQTSKDEKALLQQTSHLRRQLTLASEETCRTVQRLAGESYLVPQGATGVDSWAKAANESAAKTEEFVLDQVQAGEESVVAAKEVLARLKARRTALESLRGDL
jgi:hypothetical protein